MSVSNYSFEPATEFLGDIDADWAQLIATVGACQFELKSACEPYEALIRAVAYQQLHAKAADAIITRLLHLYAGAFPSPEQLLDTAFDSLKACGFSARKIATLQGISQGALAGVVPTLTDAQRMSNDALIAQLITLKGIGRWTVEMLLMFTLARMDVLPADDFGIVQGYKRLKKLNAAPKRREMLEIAEHWRPYRTVASWYLWHVPK